jgi:outer membrane protein assembly factor BamB
MHRLIFLFFGIPLAWLTGCEKGPAEKAEGAEPIVSRAPTSLTAKNDALDSLWTRKNGDDWPLFLGPTRDSKSAETGLITPWPEAGPKIIWQKEVGTGYGIGSVAQGRYFHFDRRKEPPGRGLARLTCSHAETGEELWKFEYPTDYEDQLGYNNGPRASPVIDGNRVYIFGAEGMLHCVQASDGQLIWKIDTAKKYGVVQNFFGVGSTPAISGDLLICMIGGSPPGSPGLYQSNGQVVGNGSGVVAFNKFTGEVKYEISDELASYASTRLATIGDRAWCFQLCRGGLLGFEPQSGKIDFFYPWRATLLESVNASMPVVIGDEVFISEAYQIGSSLLKVRPGGYDVVWKDKTTSRDKSLRAHWGTPVYVDGYLYGASGRNPGDTDLRCIEWKTGKVMWSEMTNDRSSLLYVDGHLINLGEYGTLQLLRVNPEKLEVVSEVVLRRDGPPGSDPIDGGAPRLLRTPCWAAPILAHGLLYVRGDDRVVCLEVIPDGK